MTEAGGQGGVGEEMRRKRKSRGRLTEVASTPLMVPAANSQRKIQFRTARVEIAAGGEQGGRVNETGTSFPLPFFPSR